MDDETCKYHMVIWIFADNTSPHGYCHMKMCWWNMVASN